jgi:hypothetical protein
VSRLQSPEKIRNAFELRGGAVLVSQIGKPMNSVLPFFAKIQMKTILKTNQCGCRLEENRNPSILKRKTADAEGLELLSKDERKERSPRG